MHYFGQLCVVWGIGIVAATTILYILSVTVRPTIININHKDDFG